MCMFVLLRFIILTYFCIKKLLDVRGKMIYFACYKLPHAHTRRHTLSLSLSKIKLNIMYFFLKNMLVSQVTDGRHLSAVGFSVSSAPSKTSVHRPVTGKHQHASSHEA